MKMTKQLLVGLLGEMGRVVVNHHIYFLFPIFLSQWANQLVQEFKEICGIGGIC